MANYNFKELQEDIFEAVQKLDNKDYFGKNKKLTIIEGFVSMPLQETTGNYSIGGKSLPTIVVLDIDSGQIWYFSLKQLVPKVELG